MAAALIVLPDVSHACALELRVITYNVFLRAPAWLFRNDHDTRTAHIPAALTNHDVIVLQEAFSNTHRDRITTALAATHPHRTMPLGGDDWRSFNGGVYLFSRWPIEHTDFLVFSECSGPDCLVKKGATYARVATPAGPAHVFGLHLQAERAASEIRASQLRELRGFIDAQVIPADEAVLVAGDFNVAYDGPDGTASTEFRALAQVLDVVLPEVNPAPSFEAGNTLLDGDISERLDYVLYSRRHARPCAAASRVLPIRHDGRDLSDHHAVTAEFTFPAPNAPPP